VQGTAGERALLLLPLLLLLLLLRTLRLMHC
jgi:hypothetical protein